MYKVRTTVTNSVNNEEHTNIQIALTSEEAEAQVQKVRDNVNKWNKPEPSGGYGGKMSVRWLDSNIEYIDDDTSLANLTVGMLKQILSKKE